MRAHDMKLELMKCIYDQIYDKKILNSDKEITTRKNTS